MEKLTHIDELDKEWKEGSGRSDQSPVLPFQSQ